MAICRGTRIFWGAPKRTSPLRLENMSLQWNDGSRVWGCNGTWNLLLFVDEIMWNVWNILKYVERAVLFCVVFKHATCASMWVYCLFWRQWVLLYLFDLSCTTLSICCSPRLRGKINMQEKKDLRLRRVNWRNHSVVKQVHWETLSTKQLRTPRKTNVSPENQWLADDGRCISYWNSPVLGDMLVFEGVFSCCFQIQEPTDQIEIWTLDTVQDWGGCIEVFQKHSIRTVHRFRKHFVCFS